MTLSEDEIRERYRALALDWAAAKGEPKKANRIFKEHHGLYREIRDLELGCRVIESLLDDPEPSVRLLAATHALPFASARAEAVLRDLERGNGLYAMDAKYTLINFRTGRLNLEW
ncbi:hypothetical protein [Kribbella sp. NPDC000426]|uniref:hypothetical protein n=1 Tax=Kribbella sp. NPDC000426 TaxID=3154255 RepID=UPI003322C547